MNGDRIEQILSAMNVPMELRPELREFGRLDPEEQRLRLYLKHLIAEQERKGSHWPQVANAGYTTLAILGAIVYSLTGGRLGG